MTLPAELRAEASYLRSLIPEAVYPERRESLRRQADLLHRAADALEAPSVIGECVEAGTDPETGEIRLTIHTTVKAISHGPPMVYRQVKVTPLPATPEGDNNSTNDEERV